MSTNVRMIIAMAVSVVIVIVWSMFFMPKNETPVVPEQDTTAIQEEEGRSETEGTDESTEPEEEETIAATDELPEEAIDLL